MDLENRKIDALKDLSRNQFVLLGIVVCISFYLIDRTIQLLMGELDPLSSENQAEALTLDYSFFTLSIIWPFVLATFAKLYCLLNDKINELVASCEAQPLVIKSLIPMFIDYHRIPARFRVAVGWLPVISTLFYSLTLILFMIGEIENFYVLQSQSRLPVDVGFSVIISLTLYIVVLIIVMPLNWNFKNIIRAR